MHDMNCGKTGESFVFKESKSKSFKELIKSLTPVCDSSESDDDFDKAFQPLIIDSNSIKQNKKKDFLLRKFVYWSDVFCYWSWRSRLLVTPSLLLTLVLKDSIMLEWLPRQRNHESKTKTEYCFHMLFINLW